MEEDDKKLNEPVPETGYARRHKKEDEYFFKEDQEKIKQLQKKLDEMRDIGDAVERKPGGGLSRASRMRMAEGIFVLVLALGLTEIVLLFLKTGYVDLILAGIWLYLPAFFIWGRKDSLRDFAIRRVNPGSSLKWFIIASVIIFPLFYLFCWIGALKILGFRFELTFPKNFFGLLLSQLLLISVPEEWFFRGYLQGRFNQALGRRWEFSGIRFGPGLLISAGLFALAHFTLSQSPDRLLVFFPALVFGWLRERTDSLVAPVLFHFFSNISFIIFQVSLIR